MRRVLAAAAIAALGAAAAAPAMAQQDVSYTGVYGNLGWSQTDREGAKTQSIEGRAGYRFNRYLGVEAEVKGGLSTGHSDFNLGAGPTGAGLKQTLGGAGYVVGFLPITHKFDLLARVGYGASHYDVSATGSPNFGFTENGLRFGGGAEYFFDGRNGIRADWTREHANGVDSLPIGYTLPGRDADVISVAFNHRF